MTDLGKNHDAGPPDGNPESGHGDLLASSPSPIDPAADLQDAALAVGQESGSTISFSRIPGQGGPELNRQWEMVDLGLFVVFALGTMVLVGAAVIGGFTLLNRVLGWGLTLDHPMAQTPIAVLVQILWEVLWLGFIHQVVVVKTRQNFWKGLNWEQRPISVGAYLIYGGALSVCIQLLSQLLPKREGLPIEQMFDAPASAYLLAFFGICVAPFMEELVFRGFFFPVLERRLGIGYAVLVTGGLFAVIHVPQLGGLGPEAVAMIVVGVVLSFVRARTGSLKASFLMHLGYNSTLFFLLFITTNRFQTLTP